MSTGTKLRLLPGDLSTGTKLKNTVIPHNADMPTLFKFYFKVMWVWKTKVRMMNHLLLLHLVHVTQVLVTMEHFNCVSFVNSIYFIFINVAWQFFNLYFQHPFLKQNIAVQQLSTLLLSAPYQMTTYIMITKHHHSIPVLVVQLILILILTKLELFYI